ncbi:DEAD-box ATP-dependent RNA helicase 22 isoform X1 [Prunus yedoensis var. nudiflora]|uniref:DEAD-box ATP-dependent RNA helicase 22 isoform X1 n=1 Tax=Prunus yedoensis var. nudiflora TaxID=2094558 RepID=A0A314YN78_PRUYE|nr:DEAD-box ATP-dependent RNA helicase 22 isoform X1 [Prunus yedoensis var. nudiflora]
MLPLYKLSSSPPKLFSQFRYSYSVLSNSSSSFRINLLWLSHPRRRFGTVTTAAYQKEGGDTFFTEESVSWTSLGVSDKVSQALYNAGLGQPSLVQVPSSVLTLIYSLISRCIGSISEIIPHREKYACFQNRKLQMKYNLSRG